MGCNLYPFFHNRPTKSKTFISLKIIWKVELYFREHNWPMNRIFVIWNECQWMQSPIMTTLFLCIQNAYVASLSALLVESVCTHLVYGSRQQYQLGCGVSREGKNNIFLDMYEFLGWFQPWLSCTPTGVSRVLKNQKKCYTNKSSTG